MKYDLVKWRMEKVDYNDMKCFEQEEVNKIKSDVRILLDEIQAYLDSI